MNTGHGWRNAGPQDRLVDWEHHHGKSQNRPGRRAAWHRDPPCGQERHERRRDQAAPEVVQELPPAEQRKAVPLQTPLRGDPGEEPGEKLPIPADPSVITVGVRYDARRVLVDDLHVGDERGTRKEPLQEIV